jgi:multiple sugar transport system permease protein
MPLRHRLRRIPVGYLFVLPSLLLFSIFLYGPVCFAFFLSLSSIQTLQQWSFVGLQNFEEMISDPVFWFSLRNTIVFTAISVVGILTISLFIALGFNRILKGRGVFQTVYYIPAVASIVVAAVLWSWIYFPKYGILNLVLGPLNINVSWLGDPNIALYSLAWVSIWKDMGLFSIVYLAGLQAIPETFYDAAKIDGANSWQTLHSVTLPLLKPTVMFIVVMVISWALPEIALPYQMTHGGPGYSTTLLMLYIFLYGFQAWQLGYASAMSFALVAIALVFALIQWRILKTEILY